MAEQGKLKIQCFVNDTYVPIENSTITITSSFGRQEPVVLTTNSMGETKEISVDTPPLEYSQQPTGQVPYSMYDIRVDSEGYQSLIINRCQVFPGELSIQNCNLYEVSEPTAARVINIPPIKPRYNRAETINIGPNVLNGNYPEKIPEEVDKPLPPPSSGVVLDKPAVPEFIIVHEGGPNNTSGNNYTVPYKDYIKNVASCEIYSTWPESTIRSNIYAIISFTLNRIYTEWYRGKGKPYDITNSTAYDHAFTYGRNFFESITKVVDEIFATYIRRIGRKQPLLTQYCDGKNVQCPGWMTQWGSKYLGDQGKVPYDILRHFYGNDIELVTAEVVKGRPKSYPGYELIVGSSGPEVKTVQEFLNRISQNYPLIPKSIEDGVYGEKTKEAVTVFQGVFNLPKTGIVDYATWYKISDVYVGVTKIAELRTAKGTVDRVFTPPKAFDNYFDKGTPKFNYKDDLI